MTNLDFLKMYVEGNMTSGQHGRMAYKDGRLISYETTICDIISRVDKVARFNKKKYSATTSKMQNQLLSLLESAGYTIEKYEGDEAYIWDYYDARHRKVTVEDVG